MVTKKNGQIFRRYQESFMCGLGGIVLKPGVELNIRPLLGRINKIQNHRGPDGQGVWLNDEDAVGLCHSRLAILDLSESGKQPMHSPDRQISIVFNGEIYNWGELRVELESLGSVFNTQTDTEVLIESYRHWGREMLDRLRGMYAFALFDARERLVFCARDHVGKKPFVYSEMPWGIAFASEIPAILSLPNCDKRPNHSALASMLLHNMHHIPDPHTAYVGIKRLRPGHAMLVREGRVDKIWRYWVPKPASGPVTARDVREKLEEAVRLRMFADVPVGALLSGGVDSSAIVALMTRFTKDPIRTYALGFDKDDEDLRRARQMADILGTHHKEFYFDPARQWEIFQLMQATYGEPIMLLPLLHTHELCGAIHQDGVKVVLAGHGADELFYGYTGHVQTARLSRWLRRLEWLAPLMRQAPIDFLPRAAVALAAPRGQRKAALYRGYGKKSWPSLVNPEVLPTLINVAAQEMEFWGVLTPSHDYIDESNFIGLMIENSHSVTIATDLPAMMSGVEMRAPFLDQQMVSTAFAVPFDEKVPKDGDLSRLKLILKRAVSDLVPENLLYAPKRGFGYGIPQDNLLRGAWCSFGDKLFASPHSADGLFQPQSLKASWENFKMHGSQGSNVVPNMFAIQYWLQSNKEF
ncbi:MAG: asparagine synthase (glutamine-hydrolyzing) [Desulfobulbia bacterium]|jgi:asparagine synthase (glutamine-hydrolysing)